MDDVGPEVALLQANGPAPFFGVKTEVSRSTHKTAEPEGRSLFKAVFTDSNQHKYKFAPKYTFLAHRYECNAGTYTFLTLIEGLYTITNPLFREVYVR